MQREMDHHNINYEWRAVDYTAWAGLHNVLRFALRERRSNHLSLDTIGRRSLRR